MGLSLLMIRSVSSCWSDGEWEFKTLGASQIRGAYVVGVGDVLGGGPPNGARA